MLNKSLLLQLSELEYKDTDHNALVGDLDLLEKAFSKLHGLLITTRMKKIMQDFGQRATDIYVVSFPRSGTTLMQMMLYQMTTNGNMGFEHIYDVSPWCRYSAIANRPMKSVGTHRIIKTHDPYEMFEKTKKGKFILVLRDCLDVVASVYRQALDYVDPTTDFDQLSERNMKRWFEYNAEWLENRNKLDILTFHYEDLIGKKEEAIKTISEFIEVEVNEKTLKRVLHTTSFDFMKKHESKFGEQPEQWKVYNNFIRKGKSGEGKGMFSEAQLERYGELVERYGCLVSGKAVLS